MRSWETGFDKTSLPDEVHIGPYSSIGTGTRLGERVIIDAYCRIDIGVSIDADTLLLYRANVGAFASIGSNCVIGGSVSEGTKIGDYVRSFGLLIHSHTNSIAPWDDLPEPEPSPTIKKRSFIGHGALIIGGVVIGPNSYVCAGATVTRDVPPLHIASGTNQVIHFTKWRGELRDNPLFEN